MLATKSSSVVRCRLVPARQGLKAVGRESDAHAAMLKAHALNAAALQATTLDDRVAGAR
jgi:hypothetical protein